MAPSSYHRMRPSERCEDCSTRLWYDQEGLRYCKNGHQLEGFAAHDAGEDEYGTTGRVTRIRKEKRQRAALKLDGIEGRKLYLEVLQQLLRKQLWWLVREQGFPQDLESVTRGLWGICLSMSGAGEKDAPADGTNSEGFMSSGLSDPEDSEATTATRSTWLAEGGSRRLPSLIDTLALCYLGCIILQLPIRTADFYEWAMKGDIEFLAALHSVPKHVQDRLPAKFHRSLQVRDHIKPGKLLYAVQELAIALDIQCQAKDGGSSEVSKTNTLFPPLNYVPMLVHLIQELTLPVNIYLVVKCLVDILEIKFCYPAATMRRVRSIDNPEVLLVALLVVSTKLVHPLDGIVRPPVTEDDPRVNQINWTDWQKARQEPSGSHHAGLEKGYEYQFSTNDALVASKEKTDDFMHWFEKMWAGTGDASKTVAPIRDPFQPRPTVSDLQTAGESHSPRDGRGLSGERYQIVHATMHRVEPQPELIEPAQTRRLKRSERDFCPIWRTEDDLPTQAAKEFFNEAARVSAIPLRTLLLATSQVERRLEIWSTVKNRGKR